MAKFRGAWYNRVRSNDFRNRESGIVVKKVTLQKRKGMRNKAIFFDGANFKSIEPKHKNFYSFDVPPNKSASAKRRFETQVRANHFNAKKRRSAHTRRI